MPPSFSEAAYWDKRFTENTEAFDWLLPEKCFDDEIDQLRGARGVDTGYEVLHIGSGTSMLSFHLSRIVPPGSAIRHVDFSQEGIEWGRRKEKEICTDLNTKTTMTWQQVALLSPQSLLAAVKPHSTNLIIDKSTSDAVSCGPDVIVHPSQLERPDEIPTKVHPLHILALNLAIIARPGARWLCLSYSKERFPWIPMLFAPHHDPLPDGVPCPGTYWKLLLKKEIQTEEEVQEKYRKFAGDGVHRMVNTHYMYVLERTEEVLEVERMMELLGREGDGR